MTSEPLLRIRLSPTTSAALQRITFSRLLHPLTDCSSRRVAFHRTVRLPQDNPEASEDLGREASVLKHIAAEVLAELPQRAFNDLFNYGYHQLITLTLEVKSLEVASQSRFYILVRLLWRGKMLKARPAVTWLN